MKTDVDRNSAGPPCSPSVGERYRLPWRDYAEFVVVELPYDGNLIELAQVGDDRTTATVCRNDWLNWMGETRPCA